MKQQKLLNILGSALGAALGRNTPATTLARGTIDALHHLNYRITFRQRRGKTNGVLAPAHPVSVPAQPKAARRRLSPAALMKRDAAIVAAYLRNMRLADIMRAHKVTAPTIYTALRNAGHAPNRATRRRTSLLVKAK